MSTTAERPTTAAPVDPVARAVAIRPLLAEQRHLGEAQRRLTDTSVAALAEAGQLRMWVPARYGGLETDTSAAIDATAQVSAGDPAAGWVSMILGCADFLAGLLDEQAQDEIWSGSPDTEVCAVFNPSSRSEKVPGGWRVTGKWMPASGCRLASWALLGSPLVDDPKAGGGTTRASVLVPMSDLEVTASWDAIGMRATASDTLEAADVFVPEHRVLRLGEAVEGRFPGSHRASWRFRSAPLPTLCAHMMAVYLGMAASALDVVLARSGTKGLTFSTYSVAAESGGFQTAVAQAACKIDAMWALAHHTAQEIDWLARTGSRPTMADRARFRGWTAYVAAECRAALDQLVTCYGASAFGETNALGATVRDMHAASRHAMANQITGTEIYGRALLGQPSIATLI
jgi:3-hydroxy-9,10-secoandrosta-1,3,5(10)-triene-9,17-dione monooxygenase